MRVVNLKRHRPSPLPLVFFGVNAVTCLLFVIGLALLTGCATGPIPEGRLPPPSITPPPVVATVASEGSLYRPYQGLNLFEDTKARNAGDLLTVLLIEKTQASKSASTSTNKSSSAELGDVKLLGQGIGFESGISGSHGLIFTGTPAAADFDKREAATAILTRSAAVDLLFGDRPVGSSMLVWVMPSAAILALTAALPLGDTRRPMNCNKLNQVWWWRLQ